MTSNLTFEDAIYRTECFNAENQRILDICKRKDSMQILKHLFDQDFAHPDLFFDEKYENRFGWQEIVKYLEPKSKKNKILDVGCGNCELLFKIKEIGFELTGLDVSPIRVINNRQLHKNISFGFTENMPIGSSTQDIIIATELLEHVMDVETTLEEFKRVLKTGGEALIQVPLERKIESTNHVRLFDENNLTLLLKKYFNIRKMEIIPYLVGEVGNSIFCIATND